MTTKFEYLVNAMENAAAQERPADHDYFGKRQAVLKYVAQLESEPAGQGGWIAVGERLPKPGDKVLTYQTRANGLKIIETSHHWTDVEEDGGWYVEDQSFTKQPIVTHWMPLPSPPASEAAQEEK